MAKPSENALGAPTEGLGQNVTFAYSNEGGVPQLEIGDPGRIRAGVIGGPAGVGGTSGRGVGDIKVDNTLGVLVKVGAAIMAPMIEQKKTENFVAGMQRAMQGEAVTDIAKSDPWYANLFGASDTVEGARAYIGNTKAQTIVASMEDQMPEIRKMSGPEAQKYFTEAVLRERTGDAPTDMAVMQGLTRAMPAIMRRQAKEHYAYQQERATASEDASYKSGADLVQRQGESLADGIVTPEDFAAEQLRFVRAQVPASGRDEKNWKMAQTARYIDAARQGKFYAVNAGRVPLAEGGPSVFDTLDPEQRNRIEQAVAQGEATLRNKFSGAWSNQLSNIEAAAREPMPGSTTEQLAKTIDDLNNQFKLKTGSKADFILPRERAAYLSGNRVAIQRDYAAQAREDAVKANKLATEGAKAEAAALKVTRIDDALARGRAGTLAAAEGYTNEQINARAIAAFGQLPTPADQDNFLVRLMGRFENGVQVGDGYTVAPIANQKQANFNSALSAAALTDQTRAVIADAARLHDLDQVTFDRYYGDLAPKISGYLTDVAAGAVPEGAFMRRFIDNKKRSLSDKDMKTGIEAVTKEYNSWGSSVTGVFGLGQQLQPGQARQLASALGETARNFADVDGDVSGGFVRAMKGRPDIEVQGGYVFRNAPGQRRLDQYLNNTVGPAGEIPVADPSAAFKGAVEFMLYGSGDKSGVLPDKATDVLVYRIADDKTGVPQFTLAANVDGKIHRAHLSAKDIYKFSARKAATKAAAIQYDSREATADRLLEEFQQ